MAADIGLDQMVQILLANKRVEINSGDNNGWTPLLAPAANDRARVVQILLQDQHVDVNCRINENIPRNSHGSNFARAKLYERATPLHLAAQFNFAEIVQVLLADPRTEANCKNKMGDTPLMHHVKTAHVQNSVPILRLLLNHSSVDLYTTDEEGNGLKEVAR